MNLPGYLWTFTVTFTISVFLKQTAIQMKRHVVNTQFFSRRFRLCFYSWHNRGRFASVPIPSGNQPARHTSGTRPRDAQLLSRYRRHWKVVSVFFSECSEFLNTLTAVILARLDLKIGNLWALALLWSYLLCLRIFVQLSDV